MFSHRRILWLSVILLCLGAAKRERRQSLDLYLPAPSAKKPPLLIFVHGGFWLLSDDQYRIGAKIADALVKEGVAVALLRYRLTGAALLLLRSGQCRQENRRFGEFYCGELAPRYV